MSSVGITKREVRRKKRSGEVVTFTRYVVSFRNPKTGKRTQKFFDRQKAALAEQSKILVDLKEGNYADRREVPTVSQAFDHWLELRRGQVKGCTLRGYGNYKDYIVGPLLLGTHAQRREYTVTGRMPEGCQLRDMLGGVKVNELTTGEIRVWHKFVADSVGHHTANRCRLYLQTILGLAAEDFNVRPPPLPRRLGRGKPKAKKLVLSAEQVKTLLEQARNDRDYGAYYAFLFLTGARPSEMLGLLWSDVDFVKRTIRICRMQEANGDIANITKTIAGSRIVPMSGMLHDMLLDWRDRCPRREGMPPRVFPNIGFRRHKPEEPRKGGGNCLLYANFRSRVWCPALKRAALPPATPHSARHFFISALQMQGTNIAVVSKLAGHANPAITLGVYTHSIGGTEVAVEAVEALARAFWSPGANDMAVGTAA
jgi:integrase